MATEEDVERIKALEEENRELKFIVATLVAIIMAAALFIVWCIR